MSKLGIALAALLALTIISGIVGCGGGEETPTFTSTPTLTPTPTPTPAPTPTPIPTSTPTPTGASGKVIRLYYYGPSLLGVDPATLPGAHRIYSATSSDGISFQQDSAIRFSYDTRSTFGITDPDVVHLNDGSWLMFTSLGASLIKATASTSSGTFIRDESFSWNYGGISGSYNFDGSIRTFVCFQGRIDLATYDQNDGTLNYAKVAINPPPSGFIADPSVIQVGDEYLMFYKYATSSFAPPSEHEIYLATSADGITWSQHTENRFIGKGSVPGAVYYNDTIYVYYSGLVGRPGVLPPDMGVAISSDNGATFTFSTINIQGKTAAGAVDPSAVVVGPGESALQP